MKKKIYFIQPTYRDQAGSLLKGKKLYLVGLALPALSATIPDDWQKEFCYEYFDEVKSTYDLFPVLFLIVPISNYPENSNGLSGS